MPQHTNIYTYTYLLTVKFWNLRPWYVNSGANYVRVYVRIIYIYIYVYIHTHSMFIYKQNTYICIFSL